jgi:hypothetical protein
MLRRGGGRDTARGDGRATRGHPVDPEQYQRSDHRDQDAADIDAGNAGDPEDHVTEEPTDHGSDDSDQSGHDEATRVASRHDRLRNGTSDEPENDPSENTHVYSLQLWAASSSSAQHVSAKEGPRG